MKLKQLLTKSLLAVAMLGVGGSAWADDITTLPFSKTWTTSDATSPFDAGSVSTGTNVTALNVNNTTATAWFDSDTSSDGKQPYTLSANEEVTVSFTAYHGWLSGGSTQGVRLKNSEGYTIAEYVYNVGNCNITDVKIGGGTASTFSAAYGCQSSYGTGGANGFTGNSKPYVTTAGYNPVITITVRYDGYVTLNVTQGQRSINNTYTGNLPGAWAVNIAKIEAYASSNNSDRTLAINNLSITSAIAEFANYTVKYVDSESNPIDDDAIYSGAVDSTPTLISADKAPRYNAGNTKKYVYASDDASSKTIAANGSTVVTVTFTTYEKYDYSVTNSMGQTIDSGSLFEDETKVVSYPKYAQYNGAYYVTTTPYQTTVSNSNKTPVVSYSASDVSQFVEATSSNWGATEMSDGQYSSGTAYRGANSAKTMITADATGVYKLTYAVCSNSTGSPRTLYIYKNSEADENKLQDDLSVTWSLNYINSTGFKTIDNISLNAGDAILFKGSDTNIILDYVALSLKSVPTTISAVDYSTFASDYDLNFSTLSSTLKAYKATVSGSTITFTAVTTVPAGEGVLLKSVADLDANTVFNIPVTTGVAAWGADDNAFVRGTGAAVATGTGPYNYVLSTKSGVVGFYQAAGQTVPTNKCYLQSATNAARVAINFDDEATGLKTIDNGQLTIDNAVYDLQGRKVIAPTKGLYIVNGKKVVVK